MNGSYLERHFIGFRPSDRRVLLAALETDGGPTALIETLRSYLRIWGSADWLDECKLERIATWLRHHTPADLLEAMILMTQKEHDLASSSHARLTFGFMRDELRGREMALSA